MAEFGDSIKHSGSKEEMMNELLNDSSKAFLEDIKPAMTQTKVEAEANWWRGLSKDSSAPLNLKSADMKALEKDGWKVESNEHYSYLSKQSADGKLREEDIYSNANGERLSTSFLRYEDKAAMDARKHKQSISVGYMRDGVTPYNVTVNSNNFASQFEARFNKDGTLRDAKEWGSEKDSTSYTFRSDGTLYEALKRSNRDSSVVNDQLFDKKGAPRSDYNPLYLYEKVKRPVENIYMGIREISRSGGMF